MCAHNASVPDRSSELIYEWDSIHLDGVSWRSSDVAFSTLPVRSLGLVP